MENKQKTRAFVHSEASIERHKWIPILTLFITADRKLLLKKFKKEYSVLLSNSTESFYNWNREQLGLFMEFVISQDIKYDSFLSAESVRVAFGFYF